MVSSIRKLLVLFSFFMFSLTVNFLAIDIAKAQCIACLQSLESGENTCITDFVERDGNMTCTCAGGCSCSGVCTYEPQLQMQQANLLQDLDEHKLSIPQTGLVVKLNNSQTSLMKNVFNYSAYISNKEIRNVFMNDEYAIQYIDNSTLVVYKVNNGKVDLYNCTNDMIAVLNSRKVL